MNRFINYNAISGITLLLQVCNHCRIKVVTKVVIKYYLIRLKHKLISHLINLIASLFNSDKVGDLMFNVNSCLISDKLIGKLRKKK